MLWIWKEETKHVKWNEIQEALLAYATTIEEYRPDCVIIDEQKFGYIWIPDSQEWFDHNIAPVAIKVKIKKNAIVQSSDIFIATSVEQLMDEENAKNLIVKFFSNVEDAWKWISK